MSFKVFVSGGITENTFSSRAWRDYVEDRLAERGIVTLNPIRDRLLREERDFREIVDASTEHIRRSNLLLAEFTNPSHPYIGTSMEVKEAYSSGIPVVVWAGELRDHIWLRYHAGRIFEDLDEALKHVIRSARRWEMREE